MWDDLARVGVRADGWRSLYFVQTGEFVRSFATLAAVAAVLAAPAVVVAVPAPAAVAAVAVGFGPDFAPCVGWLRASFGAPCGCWGSGAGWLCSI